MRAGAAAVRSKQSEFVCFSPRSGDELRDDGDAFMHRNGADSARRGLQFGENRLSVFVQVSCIFFEMPEFFVDNKEKQCKS